MTDRERYVRRFGSRFEVRAKGFGVVVVTALSIHTALDEAAVRWNVDVEEIKNYKVREVA